MSKLSKQDKVEIFNLQKNYLRSIISQPISIVMVQSSLIVHIQTTDQRRSDLSGSICP